LQVKPAASRPYRERYNAAFSTTPDALPEPLGTLVPNVTVNLYREGTGPGWYDKPDSRGHHPDFQLGCVGQGFRADWVTPNMSCTGQDTADPFFSYTWLATTNFLNPGTPLFFTEQLAVQML